MAHVLLSEKMLRELVSGVVRDTLSYREQLLCEEFDYRYKNVKLLMKNYRKLKLHCEKTPAEVMEVNSVLMMNRKTNLMLGHVDTMLTAYKEICQASTDSAYKRRWECVFLRYIDESKMKVESIAACLHIDKRTFYRDISQAMKDLAVLLFGVEAMNVSHCSR